MIKGPKCPDGLEVKESECLEAALGVGTLYNLKNEFLLPISIWLYKAFCFKIYLVLFNSFCVSMDHYQILVHVDASLRPSWGLIILLTMVENKKGTMQKVMVLLKWYAKRWDLLCSVDNLLPPPPLSLYTILTSRLLYDFDLNQDPTTMIPTNLIMMVVKNGSLSWSNASSIIQIQL